MAHPVIDDTKQEQPKEKIIYKTIQQGLHEIKLKVPLLVDSLVLLTIAFWYFFFTGIALILGRQLPKSWLNIGTQLPRGRIAQKIQNKEVIKKPNSIKVVDLETHKPIPLTA